MSAKSYGIQSRKARGFKSSDANVRITVTIPAERFNKLKVEANRHGLSLSAQIDDYIETGLTIDESLRHVSKEAAA
jgi:hypothetical protein